MVEKIKYLCKINGISIAKLEKELGFASKLIFKWEKGNPTIANVKAVADYFNVSVDYIMGNEPKEPISKIDQQFLIEYKKLTAEKKEHLRQYMQFLAEKEKEVKKNA